MNKFKIFIILAGISAILFYLVNKVSLLGLFYTFLFLFSMLYMCFHAFFPYTIYDLVFLLLCAAIVLRVRKFPFRKYSIFWVCFTVATVGLMVYPYLLVYNFEHRIQGNTAWVMSKSKIYFKDHGKLYSINIDGSEQKEIVVFEKGISDWDFSPNGKFIFLKTADKFFVWDIEEKILTNIELVDVNFKGWLKDSSGLVFQSIEYTESWGEGEATGYPAVYVYSMSLKTINERNEIKNSEFSKIKNTCIGCEYGKWPASSSKGEIAYQSFLGYFAQVIFRDKNGDKKKLFILPIAIFPRGLPSGIDSIRWIPNSTYAILKYSSDILILDSQSGKIGRLATGSSYWFEEQ